MIKIKYGDLLDATEDVICHQCNVQGIFGGGLAAQIGKRWPQCAFSTEGFAEVFGSGVLGMVHYWKTPDGRTVCNCFTQREDFTTDYCFLEKAFTEILTICKESNLSVAVPFQYGCGIAHGDWNQVLDIFTRLSTDIGVDINVYYLKGSVQDASSSEGQIFGEE